MVRSCVEKTWDAEKHQLLSGYIANKSAWSSDLTVDFRPSHRDCKILSRSMCDVYLVEPRRLGNQ